MSTQYQQYVQNVEFLNHKHERDSNQDIEVIIEEESTTEKLKQLVYLLKNLFDEIVNVITTQSNTTITSKKTLDAFLSLEEFHPLQMKINEELSIEKFFSLLVNAASTLDETAIISSSKKSSALLLILAQAHDYIIKSNYAMFFDNSISGLLKKDMYLSIIVGFDDAPVNFASLLLLNQPVIKVENDNILDGISVETICNFIRSKAAMTAYRKVFLNQKLDKHFKKKKVSEYDRIIETTLVNFITHANIYKTNLQKGLAAVTIFNLNIIINQSIFEWDNSIVRKAYIITVILHELCHCMQRLIERKSNDKGYFNDTIANKECYESGEYFDKLLFDNNSNFSELDSSFILNIKNWDKQCKWFCKAYKDEIERIKKQKDYDGIKAKYKSYCAKYSYKDTLRCSRSYRNHK